jgi:creatinine amidohydrolase
VEPDGVREESAVPGDVTPIGALLPRLRADGVRAISPTGVLGDPAGATRTEGAALLRTMADALIAGAQRWRPGDDGRL